MADLGQLVEALNCSHTAWRRVDGDWRIEGRNGWIYAQPEGFYIYYDAGAQRTWTFGKREMAFCKVTQDGDDEGFLFLNRLPNEGEAEIIRNRLGIRKKKVISEEARTALRASIMKAREKRLPADRKPGQSGEVA